MQDGAAVTGTVTSTFTAPPNYEWTIQSGTVSIDGTLSRTAAVPVMTPAVSARDSQDIKRARISTSSSGTHSSNALAGDAVMEGCLEADNILRECSGWRRPGGRTATLGARRGLLLRGRSGR